MGVFQSYVILPARGLLAESKGQKQFLLSLNQVVGKTKATAFGLAKTLTQPKIKVLDSIGEIGAKLVEMSPNHVEALRAQEPGLRIVPVVTYRTAEAPRATIAKKFKAKAVGVAPKLKVTIQGDDGAPVAGADVIAFTDFAAGEGAAAKTNASGVATLSLGASAKKIDRLYVYPRLGYWSLLKKKFKLKDGDVLTLAAIKFPVADGLDFFNGAGSGTAGQGVVVGVIDTGSGPHPDLNVAGGANTVTGESPSDYHDNGDQHGTHVAGIIAARGKTPTGRTGIAPAATIRAYRVFGAGSNGATNFAIAKAINLAVADGCDLINMSLGGGPTDPAIVSAIADARSSGTAVIVAAGNDGRLPVSFPANDQRAVAVSAAGRKGTFSMKTTDSDNVAAPFGKDKANFVAAFSNIGPEIDVTGAGVAVVSTVPGGYAVMSGTSMACPAVTGAAARLLSQAANKSILNMPRTQARSDAILQLIYRSAVLLQFGSSDYEGVGLPN